MGTEFNSVPIIWSVIVSSEATKQYLRFFREGVAVQTLNGGSLPGDVKVSFPAQAGIQNIVIGLDSHFLLTTCGDKLRGNYGHLEAFSYEDIHIRP